MNRVSILIPTLNRSEFLIRQLRYYASVNSPHSVYIGDASNQEEYDKTKKVVNELKSIISIQHNHWPKLNDRKTLMQLGLVAEEKYCAFTGDDDFLIPVSLSKCADFLEKNHDFRTAQGRGVLFSLNNFGEYGGLKAVAPYAGKNEVLKDSAWERILHFGQNYWTPQFSVHRRQEYVEDSSDYEVIADRRFGELIHNFTFICKGKSKFIDGLHVIRHGHDLRGLDSGVIDWLISPDWQPSFQLFLDSISNFIVKLDNIPVDDARESVRQAFLAYFEAGIINKYGTKKYKKIIIDKLRESQIMQEVLKSTRFFRSKIFAKSGEISLPSLLNSASPYHNDFNHVYNIITKN